MLWKDTRPRGELGRRRRKCLDRLRESEYGLRRQRGPGRRTTRSRGVARSVDAREGCGCADGVRPVPDAGELQANVSLADADKNVADGSKLSRATVVSWRCE
jgi:hypothetical protein